MRLVDRAPSPGRLVRLVLVLLWALWALGVELLYHALTGEHRSHQLVYVIGGWAAVAVTGVLILVLMIRSAEPDPRAREMLRSLEESLRAIDLLTAPTSGSWSLDQALGETLGRVGRVLSAEAAVLYLLGEDDRTLTVRSTVGLDDLSLVGREIPVGKGVAGRVAASNRPVVADDLRRHDVVLPGLQDRLASLAAVPLHADDRLVGVLAVGSAQPRTFADHDVRLLRLAGDRLAAAVERARLYDEQRRARLSADGARSQFAVLAEAGEILAGALDDYQPALQELGRMLVPGYGDLFCVTLAEGDGAGPNSWAWGGRRRDAPPSGPEWDQVVGQVLSEGRSRLLFEGAKGRGERGGVELLRAQGFQSLMVVPIRVRGLSFGALSFATFPERRGYRPSDVKTAEQLAQRVAAAIERVLLYQEAREAEQAAVANASQLRRLMAATLTVNRPLSEGQIISTVAEQARRVMQAAHSVVTVARLSGQPARAASPSGDATGLHAIEELISRTGRSARGGPGEVVPAPAKLARAIGPAMPKVAWLGAPLTDAAGQPIGSIVLLGAERGTFSSEDEAILVSIAQMASVALGNARLYEEVQANGQRLQTLMESSPLAIIELDLDGNARWWNRAASSLFGWQGVPDGSSSPDLGAELSAELSRLWYRAVRGQATVGVELPVEHSDRGPLQVSVSTAPMHSDSGAVTGIMALIEDVTERKLLEDQFHQAERLEAMGRLAGGVAHDFNNLVSVILGYSEMLLRSVDDDPTRQSIESIARAGRRAAALTGQLLAVGRREMGRPVVVDPVALVRDIEPMVRSLVGADVKTRFRLDARDARVLIDPSQLERVILNLAINARDAMPSGGRLTVQVSAVDLDIDKVPNLEKTGRYAELSVADSGMGMDPETVEHCLEPFFTTKDRTKGTGLGLAAVHGIVTSGGGQVLVRSRPGRGTTFTVRLPVTTGDVAAADEAAAAARAPRAGSAVILLVEDEPELRTLACRSLEAHGYKVFLAANGPEALALVPEISDLDLLVTDVIMPDMGGPELARRLQEDHPGLAVLFISGYAGDEKLQEGRLPTGADLLPKPFGPEELRRRVEDALDRASLWDRQGSKR